MINKPYKFPKSIPITGKYAVIQMQRFSDSGNTELPIDIQFVSFFPDKIILQEKDNEIVFQVGMVVLIETETHHLYYIGISQGDTFLLLLSQDELLKTTMPNLSKLTTDDGREGIMYGLHKTMYTECLEESTDNKIIARESQLDNEAQLIPYRKKDKWGFCTEDKKIIIDCVYDEVTLFSKDDKSLVKINGNTHLINNVGKIIVMEDFDYDRYFVWDGIKYLDGKIYDETKYWDTKYWTENRYHYLSERLHTGDKYLGANLPGNYKIENLAPIFMSNNMFGFINSNGELIIDPIYVFAEWFYEDVAYVQTNEKSGFINQFGKFIFPPKSDIGYGNFSEGLAYCVNSDGCGYINKKGEIVIPCIYYGGANFSEGLAGVKLNSEWKYGYINKNGETVVPFIYEYCGQFSEGLGSVCMKVESGIERYGFVDKNGNNVVPIIYESVSKFENGLSKVKFDSKWGYINKKGVQYWED